MPDQKIPALPINPVKLSYDDWCERFKPIANPIDDNASYEGTMFETYGKELDYVHDIRTKEPGKVWTITASGEYTVLGNGYHYVDREGYFITEVACPEGEDYEIVIDAPKFNIVANDDGSYRVIDSKRDLVMCIVHRDDRDDGDETEERAILIRDALKAYV